MPYVQRDNLGKIIGRFANLQEGFAEEYLNDDDVELTTESPEQIIARLESAIDRYLDAQAQSFRYESIRTMVTYENDPNPKFHAEGVGAKAFRSAVYTLSVSLIDEVQSGLREVPTEAELIAEMPLLSDFIVYPA